MASTYQNRSRTIGYPTTKKSRAKKPISQQYHSTIKNNPNSIKIRFGNNSSQNSMYKPTSILKKKTFQQQQRRLPYNNRINENVLNWQQPTDLDLFQSRPFYSPIVTPPRLRQLVTPPGSGPYQNYYNLRRFNSPLPPLDDLYSPPIGLDSWGLNSTDYRSTLNANLIRRYPSPLSRYGLGSELQRQKKPYIVVPHLSNLLSPPVSGSDGGNFILPSRRIAPVYDPVLHYAYPERMLYFPSQLFHRELSDYASSPQNEAFTNHYINDFIDRSIENEFIPDMLLEVFSELDQEKKQNDRSYRSDIERYYTELNRRMNQDQTNNYLMSDDLIRELDYQRPHISTSNFDSNLSLLRSSDFQEDRSLQTINRLRYHDLPSDVQGRLLTNINQELVDFEIENMLRELSSETLADQPRKIPMMYNTTYNIYNTSRPQVDQIQYNTIEDHAQNKLLDTICLDELIQKYLKQNGSIVDIDDLSRLLDVTMLHNLVDQYQQIDENRSRTLDNYASNKFHINSYMNVTMDLLLNELSSSLIEDMKDLDEQKRRTF
ncbi:unnamed protein product [Rotaria sordida]|uniref:Uncharacterized protein n=1 Tax=Rotaria sordida TaxID=392033 RepID=A0A813T117_9BILA|nr:unnamed protein product [Rotaria sordida]CAF0916101.1 unnamed protein product [Rotaria sordida]